MRDAGSKPVRSAPVLDPRQGGRQLVFSTIRAHERIARIDISNETQISPATVTSITAEMIAQGLIEETPRDAEAAALKRGRPRVDLKVRGASHIVAGLKFSNNKVTVAILDFEGAPVGDYEQRLPAPALETEAFIALTKDVVTQAAKSCGMALSDLSGIGIGLAGIVDAPKGFVHWSPQLVARNVDLRPGLEAAMGLPVFLDNDANLVAMAEQWFGLGRNVSDFIVVTIENGVGMGIVIDGQIYRGTRGCGAEFGHTKVQLDGALCRCGQKGCLEAYLADYALLQQAGIPQSALDPDPSEEKLMALFREAKAGNTEAMAIFDRAGRMFAMGLANLVNIFDPALIILSGERMQFEYLYEDKVIEQMRRSVVQVDMSPPDVRIHTWGDLMWARGAAAYAMEGVTEIALKRISLPA